MCNAFQYLPGNVILAFDLCCSNSLFSVLNKKTLNARCNKPKKKKNTESCFTEEKNHRKRKFKAWNCPIYW